MTISIKKGRAKRKIEKHQWFKCELSAQFHRADLSLNTCGMG